MYKTTAWDEWEANCNKEYAEGVISALLRVGRQRFGDPDAKTEASISAIEDFERLDRMLDQILAVKSWKALLSIK